MDVAFVSNVAYPFVKGGAEKRIHEFGTRLVDRGHQVTVYTRHWWDGPDEIQHEGLHLRAVAPSRELYTGDRRSIREALEFSARLLRPLRSHVREHDVVDASVFPYFPVLSAVASGLGTSTPLCATWHEVWGDYWSEYLGVLAPFGKATEQLVAASPHKPIAVSEVTASRLANIGPDRDQIAVVPNGVDFDWIRAVKPAEDGFDVLFAGRLIPDKNVDLLLEAFDSVAEEYPARLGIIGDGPRREALERRAASLDNSNRVTFLGFLEDHRDVIAHMLAASIFVSPSTREGFGITLVEAMAAGCTVVAVEHPTSTGSEIVGDAGFLTSVSAERIGEALRRALSGQRPATDPIERAESFDWTQLTDDLVAVYSNLVESPERPT